MIINNNCRVTTATTIHPPFGTLVTGYQLKNILLFRIQLNCLLMNNRISNTFWEIDHQPIDFNYSIYLIKRPKTD